MSGAMARRAAGATIFVAALTCARSSGAQGWEPTAPDEESVSPTQAPPPEPESPSESDSPSTPIHFDLGADALYMSAPIHGGPNPFGAGFGGRAALTFGHFYAGARVVDFLGDKDVDVSYRALLAGAIVGYEIRAQLSSDTELIVRPEIGAGDAVVFYTDPSLLTKADVVTTASGQTSSSRSDTITVNNVYVDPSVAVLVRWEKFYVGAGVDALVLPGIVYGGADATTWLTYGAGLRCGARF